MDGRSASEARIVARELAEQELKESCRAFQEVRGAAAREMWKEREGEREREERGIPEGEMGSTTELVKAGSRAL